MKFIGILEDNVAFREVINEYLQASGDYIVFSEGSSKSVFSRDYDIAPDFILLDVHLADELGLDVISKLKSIFRHSHIIMMTGDNDREFLLMAIENGASGYLYKPFMMSELDDVFEKVQLTGSFLAPEVLTKLIKTINQKNVSANSYDIPGLTPRESDIVGLLKLGFSYKEMADQLGISFHTVNYHLKNIYQKADVRSKSELVANFFKPTGKLNYSR